MNETESVAVWPCGRVAVPVFAGRDGEWGIYARVEVAVAKYVL